MASDVVGLGKLFATLHELRAEMDQLKSQLAEARQEIARLRSKVEAKPHPRGRARLFLSLRGAATALGVGRARLQELIRAGELRTVPFPNGTLRVPRSEIERIDALGLDVTFAAALLVPRETAP